MNNLSFFIEKWEAEKKIRFTPTKDFYKSVGVGQRRFGQLYRNECDPKVSELKKIAQFFGINYYELIAD